MFGCRSRVGDGIMKSAFDCFQHAAKCEEMAAVAIDDANRTLLLATAAHWRALGKAAKTREQRKIQLATKHVSGPRNVSMK
jgi:hypothetical protein